MSFADFLDNLLDSGRVQVLQITPLEPGELAQARERLAAFEQLYRRQMPETAPPYAPEPALWAAMLVYRACQLLAYRDYGVEQLEEVFAEACPDPASPSAQYSVDLVLRLLPDLMRLARAASPDDPLVRQLHKLAVSWPLSSVGMAAPVRETEEIPKTVPTKLDIRPILKSPSLLMLYVDRIIACNDLSRLADPRIAEAAASALGLFPELAPTIASALETAAPQESTS